MNVLLWVLQVLLALHTTTGAVWKLSNSEQKVPSLKKLPREVWDALIGAEFACSLGLILPALYYPIAKVAPAAATCIAAEMLLFSGVHLASGTKKHGPMIYWLIVAGVSAFIAVGRFWLWPF